MDVMGFVMDNMGHFAPIDVLLLLFAVLCAALLGLLLGVWGGRLDRIAARDLALWAGCAAFAAGLVRMQLPLAVVLLAFVVLVKGNDGERRDRVLRFGAVVLGLGCGSGASLVVLIVAVPFIALVRWAFGSARS